MLIGQQMGALLGTGIIGKSFSALDMTTGDPVVIKELNMHLIPAAMVKPIRVCYFSYATSLLSFLAGF